MKCLQCAGAMVTRREMYDYSASGLPVTLHDVNVSRCKECGEHEVELPNIDELHALLARRVIRSDARLVPREVKFLRKWLGLTGVDLADVMGVTPEQVSRWESGARDMGAPADRLLRMLVATREPRDDYSVADLRGVRLKAESPTPLDVRRSRSGWRVGSAA